MFLHILSDDNYNFCLKQETEGAWRKSSQIATKNPSFCTINWLAIGHFYLFLTASVVYRYRHVIFVHQVTPCTP